MYMCFQCLFLWAWTDHIPLWMIWWGCSESWCRPSCSFWRCWLSQWPCSSWRTRSRSWRSPGESSVSLSGLSLITARQAGCEVFFVGPYRSVHPHCCAFGSIRGSYAERAAPHPPHMLHRMVQTMAQSWDAECGSSPAELGMTVRLQCWIILSICGNLISTDSPPLILICATQCEI